MQVSLCLEQTLGHRAHAKNLVAAFKAADLSMKVIDIHYPVGGSRIPWAVAGSWSALQAARAQEESQSVRFFHTQTIALFAPLVSRRTPFVVSVDATPMQMDGLGQWYDHEAGSSLLEWLKWGWYRAMFRRASAVVAWSNWAADSLTASYGVPRTRILVAHPGAAKPFFEIERDTYGSVRPRILFVGGDLKRKGADLLLESLPSVSEFADLTIVSPEPIPPTEGLTVIADAMPGTVELFDAYASADVFCLPTRGDCTPVVLGEAMAAGLPVVTTRVGSNAETVSHGVDGFLVDVDDREALIARLRDLCTDPELRRSASEAARAKARELFDADRNAARILRLLESVAR
jgi:glycosyltransferase involved in cell wall biosynthesis